MNSVQSALCGFLICVALPLSHSTVPKNTADFFPYIKGNLSAIKWAHAVNSQALLKKALNDSTMMLEADVILGTLNNDTATIPIMAHPPSFTSDLSLSDFLEQVLDFNANSSSKKGIKLDFKTIEVVESSVSILKDLYPKINCPLWFNADILPGPLNTTDTPVDPERFINSTKSFENATLSIGWKTRYGGDIKNASYTQDDINNMIEFVQNNSITQLITFPVRAGIAAQSIDQLKKLTENVHNSTLTLWNGIGDAVDVKNLRVLIKDVGLKRVYVDLPDDLKDQLRLDQLGGGSNIKPLTALSVILIAFAIMF
ncbi:hypothetical protein RN001_004070 [Aquatica leii]|uniref:Menorin-like domain-containing protein n=1 Tax=Aquatica leii TaxID=1421715 RepID=A0AAN7PJ83_9COLE|nr:hypothetical protein RN001_004070 [Aquatica leii]